MERIVFELFLVIITAAVVWEIQDSKFTDIIIKLIAQHKFIETFAAQQIKNISATTELAMLKMDSENKRNYDQQIQNLRAANDLLKNRFNIFDYREPK